MKASVAGKDKRGKNSLTIIPFEPLLKVSKVFQYGAKKYGLNNWRKGHLQLDLLDSCLRHIYSYSCGYDDDGESGESHLAHAAANLFIIMGQIHEGTSVDNRFAKGEVEPVEQEEQEEQEEQVKKAEEVKGAEQVKEVEQVSDVDDVDDVDAEEEEAELAEVEKYNNQFIAGRFPQWRTEYCL